MSGTEKVFEALTRLEISTYIDDKSRCEACGHVYTSVDDFYARDPRVGFDIRERREFVDEACWDTYVKMREEKS